MSQLLTLPRHASALQPSSNHKAALSPSLSGKGSLSIFTGLRGRQEEAFNFHFYFFSWPLAFWPGFSIFKTLCYVNIGGTSQKQEQPLLISNLLSGTLNILIPGKFVFAFRTPVRVNHKSADSFGSVYPRLLQDSLVENFPRERWRCPWLFSWANSYKAKHVPIEQSLRKPRITLKDAFCNSSHNYTNNSSKSEPWTACSMSWCCIACVV